MDDIKLKFLELINKEELIEKIPIVTSPVEYEYNTPGDNSVALETIQKSPSDNEKNINILDNIENDYFIENGFDPSRYELLKLSDSLKLDQIENNLHHLQSQLAVVSKKVLSMILENQPACQQEFEKMQDICKSLKCGLQVCQNARTHLHTAQKLFTTASLGILSNYRRRKIMLELLKSLNTIKTLLKTEARWEELLADGDYSNAISVLLEYQQVALSYRHFNCVVVLSNKLQDTLVMAEEQLDVALAKLCYKFDANVYSKLQAAYSQLGKRRIAMDQLHMHYTSAIHSSAFNVVYHYVRQECNASNSKKPYAYLCKEVDSNKLIQCLLQLCQSLWAVLCSYNSAVHWHNMKQNAQIDSTDIEKSIDEQYIRQKLESGLGKLWHDVQSRVSLLVSSSDVSHSKFDEFLRILAILHRLIQVGEEFCGSDSAELQLSIKGQSSNYFRNYHLSRLGELRLFLENEAWTPCPVKSDFNLLHLQEFRDLRYVVQNASLKKSSKYSDSADRLSCGSSGYFSRYSDSTNTPFDGFSDLDSPLSLEEDILLNEDERSVYISEDSEDEEFDKKYKENMSSRRQNYLQKKTSVLLTNTTLTVLRHCGRYLQMSHLLRSITIDVIICLRQLFEYYLYAVCNFFSTDLPDVPSSSVQYSIYKLKSVLNRIEDNFIENKSIETNDVASSNSSKVLAPCISPMVDLTNSEQLYGLIERMVGVESLVLLSEQFNLLRDYLEHLIDETEYKHTLSLFYSQVISVASEVRIPVYECVARKIIDSKNILNLMSKVNWEVKDVMCQHSQYVDVLLRELQIFAMRLENLSGTISISSHVATYLWQSIAEFLSEIFVEGFSNAKKCSNGGRALMQLDYTQLMLNLEKLSGLKPIPKREFVESYVKAYYLPESTLQNWIVEHTEYSIKQLIALINCACSNNKKTRQRLIGIIEEAADRR